MATLRKDFCRGTVQGDVSSSATTLTSTGFSNLPVVASGDELFLTLDPEGVAGAPEVVRVTSHSSGSQSVVVQRGQLGSTARSHAGGVVWVHSLYASEINQLRQDVDSKLPLAGGSMSGPVMLAGAPTVDLHPATKKYVDDGLALKAPIASPTFTGTVTLPGAPSQDLHAATKKYVDDRQGFVHKYCIWNMTGTSGTLNNGQAYRLGIDDDRIISDQWSMVDHMNDRVVIPDAGIYRFHVGIGFRAVSIVSGSTFQFALRLLTEGESFSGGPNPSTGRLADRSFTFYDLSNICVATLDWTGVCNANQLFYVWYAATLLSSGGSTVAADKAYCSVVRVA